MQPEHGSIVAGRYRLERPLAQGAMGCVWVARHLQLDVDVAIKLMAPSYAESAEARARFEREAKASALLKVPNAVHVYDYGIETGSPFLVMELLEGEDLAARLRRQGRLSLGETLAVLEPIGKALRRAHEIGLVHRDLKPGNVFVARHGGEEVIKVVDFGIAKAAGLGLDAHATKTGALLGSPRYMSPEQVRRSNQVDLRSDLWALGVIAFECVTGQVPFPGEEIGEVLVDVCTAPIPRASQVAPGLGPELDRFFDKALMRDPDQRFQSAPELVEAFAAVVHGGAARPPAPGTGTIPMTSASQSAPGFAPRVQSAPAFAAAAQSAPGFAPAAQSAPVFGPSASHGMPAPASGTLSPAASTQGQATAQSRGGMAVLAVVSVTGAVLVLGTILFFALRSPAAPAAAAASAAPTAIPTATAVAAPPDTASAAPPAAASSAAAAPSATASADSRPRAPVRPGGATSAAPRKKNDLLDHM